MKHTIFTKYVPATNTRGSRIQLQWQNMNDETEKRSVPYDYDHSGLVNQMNAAEALMIELAEGSKVEGITCVDIDSVSDFQWAHTFEVTPKWKAPMHRLIRKGARE